MSPEGLCGQPAETPALPQQSDTGLVTAFPKKCTARMLTIDTDRYQDPRFLKSIDFVCDWKLTPQIILAPIIVTVTNVNPLYNDASVIGSCKKRSRFLLFGPSAGSGDDTMRYKSRTKWVLKQH